MNADAPKRREPKGPPRNSPVGDQTTNCCDAFSANSGGDPMPFSNGTEINAVTLDLPAGNYVINAKVLVGDRSTAGGGSFLCTLRRGLTGNIGIDISAVRLFGGSPASAGSSATLPLTGTIRLTSPETVRLHCTTTSSDAYAQWAQLNAIQVGTITP
jgi:hypothetical protein